MIKIYNSLKTKLDHFTTKLNGFLKEKTKLTDGLVLVFDWGSKTTHFLLFHPLSYLSLLWFLFSLPVYYSIDFMNFLMLAVKGDWSLAFMALPLALKVLFSFSFFLLELVCLCTFLASLPVVKEKMVEMYDDPLILKKRKYNRLGSSFRRALTLGMPLTAAIVVTGDLSNHLISRKAIQADRKNLAEVFVQTKNSKVLDQMPNFPSGGTSQRVHDVTVKAYDYFANWSWGSKTKN